MTRSLRRALRRCGIDSPFSAVVCPEHLKTIRVGVDQRTEVTVQRALVFLEPPDPDDLRDLVPADAADPDVLIRESPDAHEVARRASHTGTLVYWKPREPIVPFAIYVHQHGWSSAGGATEAALYSEFVCDVRTGIWTLEITGPKAFETAVGFKRPHWPALRTERALVKYALTAGITARSPPDTRRRYAAAMEDCRAGGGRALLLRRIPHERSHPVAEAARSDLAQGEATPLVQTCGPRVRAIVTTPTTLRTPTRRAAGPIGTTRSDRRRPCRPRGGWRSGPCCASRARR
jgi:hypothetical protein